jgi:long-chain acyl-CoA synthetase
MPAKEAIVTEQATLTYSELYQSASNVARGLVKLGVRMGDRVALHIPNSAEYMQCFFGSLLAGAIVVPVSTWLTPNELIHVCNDSDAKVLMIDSKRLEALSASRGKLPDRVVAVGNELTASSNFSLMLGDTKGDLPVVPITQEDAVLLYTSGTTGRPKGAVLTHANLVVTGLVNGLDWKVYPSDRFLVATPLANRTGIARIINSTVLGGTLCILSAFTPEAWISFVEQAKVTVAGSVPTMWRRLLPILETSPGRCATLRTVLVTAEAFPRELADRLRATLPDVRIVSFFGMTETGALTSLEGDELIRRPNSVGRAIAGVEIKILSDDGAPVKLGEVGEMLVRAGVPGTMLVMKGYYNRPDANAEAFEDGWFRTGDLCYQDEEGYVFVADRKKDMIVSGGMNIYSKELETVVNRHTAVADSAAVGVKDKDFGEAVAMFVQLKGGASAEADDLIEFCKQNLASYKKPKYIFFVPELPRNSIGKVLKRELAKVANTKVGVSPS